MPLTAAQKQKRYKEKLKLDPVKYEEYKRKKRENYHAKKRLVKDLTPKEKFNARVIWKLKKRALRQKKRNLNRILDITPPSSPSIIQEQDNIPQLRNDAPCNSPVSAKRERRRINLKIKRSNLYRENVILKEKIQKLAQECEKYKKRHQRIENKIKPKKEPKPDEKIKYKKLTNAIQEKYQNIKKRDKKLLKTIFENIDGRAKGEIIKESLGLQGQLRTSEKIRETATELKKTIYNFFIRDDISRATAGKKETITKNKTKVQKRFLLDSMKNLFKIFKEEKPDTTCSYFYFTKNRPFFVIKPSVDGREMCLCKLHVNPVYKAQVLKRKRLIETEDLNVLISSTVCDTNSQSCMYGTCQECGNSEVKHDTRKDTENMKWYEWTRQEDIYEKDGKKIKAVKNVKQIKEGLVMNLMANFNRELTLLKKHVFNMKIQFKNFRQAVNGLQENEVLVVADFSENYNCKLHEEIQAHHFGGSRQQVSLHTVVTYIPDQESKHKVESYCTISASTNHQPAAIWTHLHPVMTNIRNNHPEIKTIHFYTDGPFSQYRQKQNFYFSSMKTFDYGFTAMTWSFFEAGHGKGPADGIGGFLKRTADNMVATGRDIVCAEQFYEALQDQSKIKLYLIAPNDIDNIAKELPPRIRPLVGTLHVHQIFTSIRGELKYRNLGCFCNRGFCSCLQPKIYHPVATSMSVKMQKTVKCIVEESDDSSDDIPLSIFKNPKKSPLKDLQLLDLTKPRAKNLFDYVYNTPNLSDDDQEPSTSGLNVENKENEAVSCGDFLIVNVHATKGKIYRYACIVNNLDEDGDIFVTFLRCVKNCQYFRLDKTDMSYIDYKDIVKILDKPMRTTEKSGNIYYEFSNVIDIFEK